ncbi:MAG TPA: hypothetical protein VFP00_08495 [Burkholderiales bacterium]|nr:hypothetical protein [Burkholderiales bacterium]
MSAPETPAAPTPPEEYGTEVLCANWNPAASAVSEPLGQGTRDGRVDFSAGEAESFLDQFYRLQGA